jgi:hypothetical protein
MTNLNFLKAQIAWANRHMMADEYIEESVLQVLIGEGRVFATECKSPDGVTYSGSVVAAASKDWDGAQEILDARGFGEKVAGIIYDVIDEDHVTIPNANAN